MDWTRTVAACAHTGTSKRAARTSRTRRSRRTAIGVRTHCSEWARAAKWMRDRSAPSSHSSTTSHARDTPDWTVAWASARPRRARASPFITNAKPSNLMNRSKRRENRWLLILLIVFRVLSYLIFIIVEFVLLFYCSFLPLLYVIFKNETRHDPGSIWQMLYKWIH